MYVIYFIPLSHTLAYNTSLIKMLVPEGFKCFIATNLFPNGGKRGGWEAVQKYGREGGGGVKPTDQRVGGKDGLP